MRYIGNKNNLLEFIEEPLINNKINSGVFCDIFAGTANVSKYFKRKGFQIISNDNMYYSYVFQKAYIENNYLPEFNGLKSLLKDSKSKNVFEYLNQIKGIEGFIFQNFSKEGSKNSKYERNYFSESNATKIDAIRETIEEWKNEKLVTELEFYILLCSLLEEVPSISNIAGTYGAFLKINDPRMSKTLQIKMPEIITSNLNHMCYNDDGNDLIKRIKCDVLYIDPPYNSRQYPANYHMWETIAVWDKQLLDTKTGLRPWTNQRSDYCSTKKVNKTFSDLVKNADCKYILFSYNTDGLMSEETITDILSLKGKVKTYRKEYRRFKSNSRKPDPKTNLDELLFFVKIN